jgi:hypothetical protein
MTSDIEKTLAEGMARYVDAIEEPGCAVGAARTRLRHRRVARAVTAGGAALAVAIVTVVLATGGSPSAPRMLTDSYVIKHVQTALSGAEANDGKEAYATIKGPVYDIYGNVIAGDIESWQYRNEGASRTLAADGYHIQSVIGYVVSGKTTKETFADFSKRTWETDQVSASPVGPAPLSFPGSTQQWILPPCNATGSPPSEATLNWPDYLQGELACGTFHSAGFSTLNGERVIELNSKPLGRDNATIETLWVDPRTYLPVRLTTQVMLSLVRQFGFTPPHSFDPHTTDFQWLPPTQANLVKLSVNIPAGFREVRG